MMFSLYQIAKILNYQNFRNSRNIYKDSRETQIFVQNTLVFEYYYLKSKLLFNYDRLLDFNQRLFNKSHPLLLMKFLRDIDIKSKQNHFIDFIKDFLLPKDTE